MCLCVMTGRVGHVLVEPSSVRPRRKVLARRVRFAGLVFVVVLASACGDDSGSAGSTTSADADQPSTTISTADDESCAADDADADGLEPLVLDVVAPAFTVQPDEVPKAIVTTKSGQGGEGSLGPHFISWAAGREHSSRLGSPFAMPRPALTP